MNAIEISRASEHFCAELQVGQFVSYLTNEHGFQGITFGGFQFESDALSEGKENQLAQELEGEIVTYRITAD
jgi:hypothetical protein